MLTVEQVRVHSEITVRTSETAHFLVSYKAKISYLIDGKICRLSILEDFMPPLALSYKALREWDEDEIKLFIPANKWEAFTHFVNDNEALDEDMLLSWREVKEYMDGHKGNILGIYKILNHGEIEDIDVQANVRAIYNMAVGACKVF